MPVVGQFSSTSANHRILKNVFLSTYCWCEVELNWIKIFYLYFFPQSERPLGDYINSKEYRKPEWLTRMEEIQKRLAGKKTNSKYFIKIVEAA